MKNVMVFSCGALPAVDINIALRGNNEFKLFGASSYDDHGLYIYENYINNVPFIYEDNFIPRFNQILEEYKIDYIIPMHESMILFFQEHIDDIHATIVSSGYETALLCRYKSKTYEALKGFDFVPGVYGPDEVKEFPVFVKKDDDQGARNAYKVDNHEQLDLYIRREGMIICEYLPGEEVTVDCFTDRHGKLRFCNPRAADRILAGIDVHARRLKHNGEIVDIATKINRTVSFRGPWFFQVKKAANGKFKLLEIATRFAGAFGLSRCMDVNLPLMALRDFDGQDLDFCYNDLSIEADKMFIGRYTIPYEYDTVYLDNTDVFVLWNGTVDTFFMMFIFQCVNKRKRLVLITDDSEKTGKILCDLKLSDKLFYKTVTALNCEDVDYGNSVFISRNEDTRNLIRRKHQAICFDPSAVEVLIDWRA